MEVTENDFLIDRSCVSNLSLTQEEKLYCICSSPSSGFMIECSFCNEWYHGDCIGITETESKRIDIFSCNLCKRKNSSRRTTYKEVHSRKQLNRAKRKYKNLTVSKHFEKNSDHDYMVSNMQTFSASVCYAETNNCQSSEFLEIFSQRRKVASSTADELKWKKLFDIHVKLHKIEKQLEELDIKIIKLIDRIRKSKNPENNFVELQCDDDTTLDVEMLSKFTENRLEQFYMELNDNKVKPKDERWNLFCNQKTGKNSWCRKIKVLCPLHYENPRKTDEVCGYNLGKENGTVRYCGNKDRSCNHRNWEELLRAEIDLEKLVLFLEFKALKIEEIEIQKVMSLRSNHISRLFKCNLEY